MAMISLGNRLVGENQPCFVIAEIGQNHQGDINTAKRLIDVAKECGADCVKFQKSCLKEKFTKNALESPYVSPHSWGSTYGEHKSFLELSEDDYTELQSYSRGKNIMFTASAMDPVSLEFLITLKVPFIKIGSGDSDNLLLIEEAARSGVPLVISTGMQDLEGVKRVRSVVETHHKNFSLLHCVSAYPTPVKEANLQAITTLKIAFPGVVVGYSGHEEGYNLTLAAVALGAKIVERHITLDKTWKGNDHKCSLTREELKSMIDGIREIELAMGTGVKTIMECEKPCMRKLGKTIVASKNLDIHRVLQEGDLKIKVARELGFPPHTVSNLIGKKLVECLSEDDVIRREHLDYSP
ncbi:hypothetical protein GE061_012281 [Apolygus lucorum]|uniref:AFP-like domain-containing protein n=1 Tax=Apolygus lucorum TaxID=248454 RepID=A0A8S9XUJ9_APOLU|nr:hypothetical protein GE061_012281 [Apolygus lucorum]